MSDWINVEQAAHLTDGQKVCVTVNNQAMVICQIEGKLNAFINSCPHAGLPLGEGELRGNVLTCPFHGFAYNVENGKNIDFENDVPLRCVEVRRDNQQVQIKLPT